MTHDPQHNVQPVFRIDVSASSPESEPEMDSDDLVVNLLRELVAGQRRQNQLLDDLNQHLSAAQKQRAAELGQWKEANPNLAQNCRTAAETLSRVQTQFLNKLTEEVVDNGECLEDGEFMMNEFVDRFGPRLAHLNGVLQVLSQLSSLPSSTNTAQS